MQQMVDWFRVFLNADWEAFVAYNLEPDYDAFKLKADTYLAFCEPPTVHGVVGLTTRYPGDTRDLIKGARRVNEKSAPRMLMAVQRFETSAGTRWVFNTSTLAVGRKGRGMQVR